MSVDQSLHGGALHFVSFRGEEYWSAVKLWGRPHFVHRGWDVRATTMIDPGDVVVFARGCERDAPKQQNYGD